MRLFVSRGRKRGRWLNAERDADKAGTRNDTGKLETPHNLQVPTKAATSLKLRHTGRKKKLKVGGGKSQL